MKSTASTVPRLAALLAGLALLFAAPARAAEPVPVPAPITALARAIAAELVMRCPLADADDAAAFESCRTALQGDGMLRAQLPQLMLWGRAAGTPDASLRKTSLEQLKPQVWAQLYAPLFMFNGNHQVEWVARENQFAIRLEAAFRNRLAPVHFPYPFWHDESQWHALQHANALVLWVQPQTARIHVAQYTDQAPTASLQPVQEVARRFDGDWLAAGLQASTRTAFDGLYRADNPHLLPLDRHYRDLALQLQQAQCSQCHVPSNPVHARRLVLLATPAHAAGEIERVIATLRTDRMADGAGHPHALAAADRQWLLQSAQAFREALDDAREWETQAARNEQRVTWLPVGTGAERRLAVSREANTGRPGAQ